MLFKKKADIMVQTPIAIDPTEWMVKNSFADFLLFNTVEIQYMCLFGYTFYHGCKLFSTMDKSLPVSYKLISLVLKCTGGGILVPIFLNSIPVPLANDAYILAILSSFALHYYFPILKDVVKESQILQTFFVVLYEATRASVVVKMTYAASTAIIPTAFSFAVFGPIICGSLAGCGGAFLPLDKGLEPIKGGLLAPMQTALCAAACFHLYLNTNLSEGCVDAKKKAHVCVALFFISTGLISALDLTAKPSVDETVKEESEKDRKKTS